MGLEQSLVWAYAPGVVGDRRRDLDWMLAQADEGWVPASRFLLLLAEWCLLNDE